MVTTFSPSVRELANQVLKREAAIYPAAAGTVANALSLAVTSPPYGGVFCHAAAHIEDDEWVIYS
jgi:threonine aldolase